MRSKLLFTALALAIAGEIGTASADTLVHFTFSLDSVTYPGTPVYATLDVYANIYGDSNIAITSNNFLNYVNTGAYNNSFIHRSIPGFVIQGGGFGFATPGNINSAQYITTNAPIPLQYSAARPNTIGTFSMARTTDPNSATSQFFINTGDNTSTLGPGGSSADGYAVFGTVLNSASLANVTTIAGIHNYDASGANFFNNSNFTNLPLTQPYFDYPLFVNITSVTSVAKIGDINLDGKINVDDFLAMDYSLLHPTAPWAANNFAAGWSKGDLNLDGTVNATDYSMLLAAYQQASAPLSADDPLLSAGPLVIPEPASLTLLATGALLLLKRKRK